MTIHIQVRSKGVSGHHGRLRRPSGAVTFLFTDLVGSTRLWEDDPQAMAVALRHHERIVRTTCRGFDGYVYKMVGDAFQVAFAQPARALQAAVAVQRQSAAMGLSPTGAGRVRMALHRGCTDERANDYVGPVLNRLARLVAAGSGGQILLSQEMAVQLRPDLPATVRLADLGCYHLKDLRGVERVFEAVVADLPYAFPPLNPAVAEPALLSCIAVGA